MSQTSYSQTMSQGRSGLIYDTGYNDFISKLAEAEIAFGRFVVKGTGAEQVKLPASAAAVKASLDGYRGIAVSTQAIEGVAGASASSYKSGDAVSVMKRGRCWVQAESSWSIGGKVFVRHTASGTLSNLGIFRASAQGSAQVNTIAVATPANSTDYQLEIDGNMIMVASDASATATEVKDAFVAAINADTRASLSVSASSAGASTFTITALEAGIPFSLSGLSGILGNTATQANVANCEVLVGAKFMNAGDSANGDLAVIEFDLV